MTAVARRLDRIEGALSQSGELRLQMLIAEGRE